MYWPHSQPEEADDHRPASKVPETKRPAVVAQPADPVAAPRRTTRSIIYTVPHLNNDGQRPCARGRRCASATVDRQPDGSHEITPAYGYRAFCDPCRDMILRCIEQIPAYYGELRVRRGEKGQSRGPKVNGSGATSAPPAINLTAEALGSELVDVISSWAGRVAVVAGLDGLDTDRRIRAYAEQPLERMCRYLLRHLDALLGLGDLPMTRLMSIEEADTLPEGTPVRRHYDAEFASAVIDLDGAAAGLEIARLNSRCRWVLGYTEADEPIPGRCFECEQIDCMVRPDGSAGLEDYAQCTECGARVAPGDHRQLEKDRAAQEKAKITAAKEEAERAEKAKLKAAKDEAKKARKEAAAAAKEGRERDSTPR